MSSLQTFRETVGLALGRTPTRQAGPVSAGEAGSVRVSPRGFGGRLLGRKQALSDSERLAHPQQACSRNFLGSLAGNDNKRCRNASGANLPFSGFPVGSHEYQPWRNRIPAPG